MSETGMRHRHSAAVVRHCRQPDGSVTVTRRGDGPQVTATASGTPNRYSGSVTSVTRLGDGPVNAPAVTVARNQRGGDV